MNGPPHQAQQMPSSTWLHRRVHIKGVASANNLQSAFSALLRIRDLHLARPSLSF